MTAGDGKSAAPAWKNREKPLPLESIQYLKRVGSNGDGAYCLERLEVLREVRGIYEEEDGSFA